MQTLAELLNASQARHSHLCPRQVLGVRMALAGLIFLNLEPSVKRRKDLLVISETDGCFVDGIEVASEVSVGHRTLKIEDYGKIAATFINVKTSQAVRIHPVVNVRELAMNYFPNEKRHYFAQLKGYQVIPDSELFCMEQVRLDQDVQDIMGSLKQRACCCRCGEEIINGREIIKDGITFCRACTGDAYYWLQEGTAVIEKPLNHMDVS